MFKLEHDGTYCARLVALEYSQILSVDFTDNFAPMVNDITFHLMLSRKLIEKLSTRIIDVEMAFLYRELEDEIYMEAPAVYAECEYEIEEDKVFILDKGIYSLVQAAQQYWKNLFFHEEIGFKLCRADPCFRYKKNEKGIYMMSIYVDDNFLVGQEEACKIKSTFKFKIQIEENDYLGCELLVSENNKKSWLGQPHMIESL